MVKISARRPKRRVKTSRIMAKSSSVWALRMFHLRYWFLMKPSGPATIMAPTYTRAASGRCPGDCGIGAGVPAGEGSISVMRRSLAAELLHRGAPRGLRPQPVLREDRPHVLVVKLSVLQERLTQHAFLHGAKLAEHAVASPVLYHRARLDAGQLGVWLDSFETIETLLPSVDHLNRFPVIALNFPKFVDGRHYSTAVLLRTRLGLASTRSKSADRTMRPIMFASVRLRRPDACGPWRDVR